MTPLNKLSEIFSQYPDIQAVYLFGSMATNRTHPESDLDLAIVSRNPNLKQQWLDILTELAKQGFDRVDLSFLDNRNLILKYEAVRLNRPIYQTEDFDHGSYSSLAIRQYLDFLPFLQVQKEALKWRIQHGKV